MLEVIVELGLKGGIVAGLAIGSLDCENQRHQGLGDKAPAINAEMAAFVRTAAEGIRDLHPNSIGPRASGPPAGGTPALPFKARGRRRERRGSYRGPLSRGGSRRRRKHRPLPHRKYGPPR